MTSLLIGLIIAALHIARGTDPMVSVDYGCNVAFWCGVCFSCCVPLLWLMFSVIFLVGEKEEEASASIS